MSYQLVECILVWINFAQLYKYNTETKDLFLRLFTFVEDRFDSHQEPHLLQRSKIL